MNEKGRENLSLGIEIANTIAISNTIAICMKPLRSRIVMWEGFQNERSGVSEREREREGFLGISNKNSVTS